MFRSELIATFKSSQSRTAQEERCDYRAMLSGNTFMEFRYRDHLIFPAASLDSVIANWRASAHIEFSENFKIHTLVLKSGDAFDTEVQAKRFIIKEAKQRVDNRLKRGGEPKSKRIHKHINSYLSRLTTYCWCYAQPTHEMRLDESSLARASFKKPRTAPY